MPATNEGRPAGTGTPVPDPDRSGPATAIADGWKVISHARLHQRQDAESEEAQEHANSSSLAVYA